MSHSKPRHRQYCDCLYNEHMQRISSRSIRRILAIVFTLLVPALLIAGKAFVKPVAKTAFNYPAHDLHRDEKVSIAADPYDNPEKAKIFTINFAEHGFLPIFFIVTNDSDQPVSITNMLAGGSVFDGLDYSFTVGHEDGSDVEPNGPGGGSPELRRRLKVLSLFLQGLPLVEMRPDFDLVKHASGVATHALSSERGESAVYLDGNGPAELILNLPAGDYAVWWVDVVSGAKKDGGAFKHEGGKKSVKCPMFKGGIAMRISRREPK